MRERFGRGTRSQRRAATWLALLALTFGVCFWLRAYLPYEQVFAGEEIRFQENDAWYHMRLAQNTARNFPHRIDFDPYLRFPDGQDVRVAPLFDQSIAAIAWVLAGGRPSEREVEIAGAWLPPVLGALAIVPLFLLARSLFGDRSALFAALLFSLLPGRFLALSRLGATDHHVAEVFLSLTALLFFARGLEPNAKPATEGIAAGVALALYLLTWTGGSFLVLLLLTWAVLQSLADLHDPRTLFRMASVGSLACVTASLLVVLLGAPGDRPYLRHALLALAIAAVTFPILVLLAARCSERGRGRWLFAGGVALLGGAGAIVLSATAPAAWFDLVTQFRRLGGLGGAFSTVAETQPLLWREGRVTLDPYLFELSTAGILLPLAVAVVLWRWRKGRPSAAVLFATSGFVFFLIALAQARFAYYLAAFVAMVVGDLSARFVWPPRKEQGAFGPPLRFLLVFLLVFYSALVLAIPVSVRATETEDEWSEAFTWLRENTPEPMPEESFYRHYRPPATGDPYVPPRRAYGVLAWWDYGYQLLYRSRRIPVANPTQSGAEEVARVFLAQDEASALQRIRSLGARYVVGDRSLLAEPLSSGAAVGGLFPAVVAWAGESADRYYEVLYRRRDDSLEPVLVFYPAYYETLVVRLWAFAGAEVAPRSSTTLLSTVERTHQGRTVREIVSEEPFPTYGEALTHASTTPGSVFVGLDPMRSPVPLPEIENLRELYGRPRIPMLEWAGQQGVAVWEIDPERL